MLACFCTCLYINNLILLFTMCQCLYSFDCHTYIHFHYAICRQLVCKANTPCMAINTKGDANRQQTSNNNDTLNTLLVQTFYRVYVTN